GILAPAGHVVKSSHYWGQNATRVLHLSKCIGYDGDPRPFWFAAGSMFWVRGESLRPLLNLELKPTDFEEERGQTDGTLAHAIERLFPIAAKLQGLRLADTRVLSFDPHGPLRSDLELAVVRERAIDYKFAARSHNTD